MDPALRELIRRVGPDTDELALVVRLADPAVDPPRARVVARFGDVVTVRVAAGLVEELWRDASTLSVKPPVGLAPEVVPVADDIEAPAPPARVRPVDRGGRFLTGEGTVVAALDWGLDVAHPEFRDEQGRTRLLGLWDQRPTGGPALAPYGYGRLLDRPAVDAALATPDPYASLGYHPADFDGGRGAHGTHTLSIAAGRGGFAPEAELIFVSLGVEGERPLGSSVQLLEGLDFIAGRAGDRPLVVNLSLGKHAGAHVGRSLVERALDSFVSRRSGRVVVASAGNYFARRTHAATQLEAGGHYTADLVVDPADRTPNTVDVWYPGVDRLTVEVRHHDTGVSLRLPPDRSGSLLHQGIEVVRGHHRTGDPNTGDNQCSVIIEPQAPGGQWSITLHGDDITDGRVHLWVERDSGCVGCQAGFTAQQSDSRTTVGTIATGFRTLTVGAVDDRGDEPVPAPFSSSGPTRDGRRKPDLVAPGVAVVGARSTPAGAAPGAHYVTMSGTSMAAPAVSGVAALMLQAAGPLSIGQLRRALLSSCRALSVDPVRTGAGLLDPQAAVDAALAEVGPLDHRSLTERSAPVYPSISVPSSVLGESTPTVGPCPDVPVLPSSRPALLIRGSVHPAVRDLQRRLNRFSLVLGAAGSAALPGTPLVEDCVFGRMTQQALIAFQQIAFPGRPDEHDGKLGPHTWAQLDLVAGLPVAPPFGPPPPPIGPPTPVPVTPSPAAFVPPAPPTPAPTGPNPVFRPCCMLATRSLAGRTSFGDHSVLEPNIAYTGRAGFVDFGHLWDTCDVTAWAYTVIHRAGGAIGTRIPAKEGVAVLNSVAPPTEWLDLARSIAVEDARAHEIITYPGAFAGGHNSSFSPEDLCSNNLGTIVAARAIASGGPFVAEAERQAAKLLVSLDAQDDVETARAFARISRRWVDDSLIQGFTRFDYLLRRNFTGDPWKAGHPSDAATPAFVVAPITISATFDYTVNGGAFALADFPARIAAIRTDARARYGPDFDRP